MQDVSVGTVVNVSIIQFVAGAGFLVIVGGFIVVNNDERLEYDGARWLTSADKLDWRSPPLSFSNILELQALMGNVLSAVYNATVYLAKNPEDIPNSQVRVDIPEQVQVDLEDIDFTLGGSDDSAGS